MVPDTPPLPYFTSKIEGVDFPGRLTAAHPHLDSSSPAKVPMPLPKLHGLPAAMFRERNE